MADQTRKPKPKKDEEETQAKVEESTEASTQDLDDLLEEIDEVLETNAEEFVRSFVQKGGETIISIGLLTGETAGFRWSSVLVIGSVYLAYRIRHRFWQQS